MEIIGVIGLVLAIACLIFLSYRGVNAFIASLIASLVVIITNALPFWGTFAGGYATGFKNFAGSYFMLFGLAAAYGEFLKVTGSAESVAKVLFKIFGTKWAPLGALLITLLMAMGGVSAFVIVFAVYPVAAPLFRKANITKNLLPGIVLCASVQLSLCLP
ncbi:MAG: GntP family permease, partial [Oscillospiraceae bacterium]